tara:strand:+ start:29388 stop:30368 length:981 start_codon:yes stop_codon:yes gene_type:complete
MAHPALRLEINKILTDSDLDGVVTAAILRRWWPDCEIIFGHPGALRAGMFDQIIDRNTAVCDLPMHEKCGLSIDHHQSNEPIGVQSRDMVVVWRNTPSAARIAFDLVREVVDLDDMKDLMEWVDKLDGGSVSKEEYLSDNSIIWLGRVIGGDDNISLYIAEALAKGESVESILSSELVRDILKTKKEKINSTDVLIKDNLKIINRLAIVRLENLGVRSNGYRITALAGEDCDACIVIHGDVGVDFGDPDGYPVSASFYTNSFLHRNGGVFDLTKLATRFDKDGGGHANACGCRIKPISEGGVVRHNVIHSDIDENLRIWIDMWVNK